MDASVRMFDMSPKICKTQLLTSVKSGICVASIVLPKVSMWFYLGIYGPCTLIVELSNPISCHANCLSN